MSELDDLRGELDEFAQPEKKGGRSSRDERIIAGFEEIQQFVKQQGRSPQHGQDKDIFERIYAVRLDRLRAQEECRTLLSPFDPQGLLAGGDTVQEVSPEYMNDDELAAELGGSTGITELRHVRSKSEIEAAEEIANRERCADFNQFEPLFQKVERELKSGTRKALRFGQDAAINRGNFFVLSGQMVYIAEVGEEIKAPNGASDARLRAIYSNRTESNLLRRSLQRALYKDDAGRRLTDPDLGPLFGDSLAEEDQESGTIYVLRSHSNHPFVAEHRKLIHKIGVTGSKVETRIANAANEATYLLAEVEIVATYKLVDINRTKLENLIHRIFAPAQLDLTIHDRFGNPVQPREWFLVPIAVIDEVVHKIRDGSISDVIYNPKSAQLIPR
ncbi:MAG: GIY-YIG nuclease family protein [Fibrobacterota bacterium]|nr:GIY-YIG nuclease family protein [Fibrobacterota bacterium]